MTQAGVTNQLRKSSQTLRQPSLTLANERVSFGWQAARRWTSIPSAASRELKFLTGDVI